jgi:hypothetical protein
VLSDVTGLPASGFVKIDNEIINYGYITQNTNAVSGTLNNCFRGQQNTIAAAHTAAATVYWQQVPAITVWPTPDNAQDYTFVYWRLRRTQDAGGGVNIMDVPFRFIPCMAAGLSYYIAGKVPQGMERLAMLKAQYDEAWELAAYEDHEKAALRLVPRQTYIGR